jgi:hypothetical protein
MQLKDRDFRRAKRSLQSIQEQIAELKEEEREAKIEFLKSIELGEEYMDIEGNKFLFVGFQVRPEPMALVEWSGGVNTMKLDCIKENFLTWQDFDGKEDREARSFKVSPCNKCGEMIPSEMLICSKCQEEED